MCHYHAICQQIVHRKSIQVLTHRCLQARICRQRIHGSAHTVPMTLTQRVQRGRMFLPRRLAPPADGQFRRRHRADAVGVAGAKVELCVCVSCVSCCLKERWSLRSRLSRQQKLVGDHHHERVAQLHVSPRRWPPERPRAPPSSRAVAGLATLEYATPSVSQALQPLSGSYRSPSAPAADYSPHAWCCPPLLTTSQRARALATVEGALLFYPSHHLYKR